MFDKVILAGFTGIAVYAFVLSFTIMQEVAKVFH
jgi:hypothetical protein